MRLSSSHSLSSKVVPAQRRQPR